MALTEQQRSEIYTRICETIGEQGAEFLMAQQPPGGWEQLATKRDLADLEVKTEVSFIALNAKMDVQFAAVREQFAEVREQFAEVREQFAEVNQQFAEVNQQFAGVREQFAEVKEQFAAVDTRFAALSDKRSRDVWAFVVATVSICASVFVAAWQFAPA